MSGEALLAGGLTALVPATIALLAREPTASPRRKPIVAVIAGVGGAVAFTAAATLLVGRAAVWELAAAAALGAGAGLVGRAGRWRPAGRLALLGLMMTTLGYVAHAAFGTLPALLSRPHSLHTLIVSLVLFVAEGASLTLVIINCVYSLDRSGSDRPPQSPGPSPIRPVVAVQVAVYNEPPEVVDRTLAALSVLEYPSEKLFVMVLDDSTDPAARAHTEREAARHGFRYLHRADRRGFKAGALNDANARLPPDVELSALVDADFVVDPSWLRDVAPLFADPRIAFVQTPQAYSNAEESALTRRYAAQDAYFYRAVMPCRDAANSVIFCGTMGIVRLSDLRAAGGWSEEHICEDAEVSLRLIARGGRGVFLPRVYGRGLIPSTFHAYKRQQRRWAFGNVRIALTRGALLRSPLLDPRQRADFLFGFLHWFDGVLVLAIAAALAALGFGYAFGIDVVSQHRGEPWLVALVPLAVLLETVFRLHATLRGKGKLRLRETLGVMGLWCAIKLNNARAALLALRRASIPFLRTPKTRDVPRGRLDRLTRAFAEAREETMVAAALWLACGLVLLRTLAWGAPPGALGDVLALAAWLALYATFLTAAPAFAYAATAPASAADGRALPVRRRRPAGG